MTLDFWIGSPAGLIAGIAAGLLMSPSQQTQALKNERGRLELELRKVKAIEEHNRLMQEQKWGDKGGE